ncbi:Steroidogenic acute regulatory protein-like [Armadillidium nasatum]|uniref:Steroidogenic acute regulatory protein-like n=1 Tax=Armadillidium nasatum TaxID=96803 RepID=A0A5N5SVQ7_9CRUS|nr:Steroidogenic acute regulatory protein-like [Armadillidium nasatum]
MATGRYPSLQNVVVGPSSMNSAQTDFLMANYTSGMQLHGRMSAVRRFFCLFVTFDFCFSTLFWIICILVDGSNILEALKEQILHYTIKSSVFDVVMCSFFRFALLILFYAIIHISHWWLVALVTTFNCIFLIAKALIYEWPKDSSYPFEVMLVLISFFISWAEAWFIDFRVLPQEARAVSILEVVVANADERSDDRQPNRLERVRDYLSQYAESAANFYSPLESPIDTDDESVSKVPKRLTPQEAEYVLRGEEALKHSWDMLNSSGWNHEKTISHNDVIFSKICPRGYKIYKLMAIVEANPEEMFKECLQNFEDIPKWNTSITKSKVIQVVNSKVDITYQVAAETPGGFIRQRDFVGLRYWTKMPNCWVIASTSVTHPDVPLDKSYERGENGPNCLVFGNVDGYPDRCEFQWLLDVDLKGWIPKSVVERALTGVITEFLTSIKNYASAVKMQNMLQTEAYS